MSDRQQSFEALHGELQNATARVQRLAAYEPVYQQMMDSHLDHICLFDTDLRVTFANKAYHRLYFKHGDLTGRSLLEWIPENEQVSFLERVRGLSAEFPTSVALFELTVSDGSILMIEWVNRAVFDDRGQIIGYQATGRDVTLVHKLIKGDVQPSEQEKITWGMSAAQIVSQEQFSRVFSAMPVATVIASIETRRVLDANDAFVRLTGYERNELVGRTANELDLLPEFSPMSQIVQQTDQSGIASNMDMKVRLKSGKILQVLVTSSFVTIAEQRCIVMCVTDITRERSIQQRERATASYLRTILEAVDELIGIQDQRMFERRAVEMLRDRLKLERCAMFLVDDDREYLRGTYGINHHGQVVDEYHIRTTVSGLVEILPFPAEIWNVFENRPLTYLDEATGNVEIMGYGWIVSTAIRVGNELLGVISNDTAITGSAVDYAQQDAVVVYASLLGNIIKRRHIEQDLRANNQRYRTLVESSNAAIVQFAVDGTLLYVNDLAMKLARMDADRTAAKTLQDLYPPERASRLLESIAVPQQSGQVLNYESASVVDGAVRYYANSVSPIRDEAGTVISVMLNAFDITAVKEAQAALRENEERYRMIVETANEGIWLGDTRGQAIYVNQRFTEIFGYSAAEIIGTFIHDYVDDEHIADISQRFEPHMLGIKQQYDFLFRRKDGGEIWVTTCSTPLRDAEGNVTHTLAMMTDITERKMAEDEVRRARDLLEERVVQRTSELNDERTLLRTLIDSMPFNIYAKDLQHRYILVNNSFARVLGVDDPAKLLGKDDSHFYSEELVDRFLEAEQRVMRLGQPVMNQEEHFAEALHGIEWQITNRAPLRRANGELMGLVGISHDITALKRAEAIVAQKSEDERQFQHYLRMLQDIMVDLHEIDNLDEFYRKVVDFALERLDFDRVAMLLADTRTESAMGTYGTDEQGNLVNQRSLKLAVEPNSLLWHALRNPNHFYLQELDQSIANVESTDSYRWAASVALRQGDRNLGWITVDNLVHMQPVSPIQMEVLVQYGMALASMLARRQAEHALRESEAKYRQLMDRMGGAAMMFDAEYKMIYANDRTCELTGYTREELLGTGYWRIFDEDTQHRMIQMRTNRARGESTSYEMPVICKDGSIRVLLVNGMPMYNSMGVPSGSFSVSVDITAQKEAQETLRRALEREKELGQLKTQFVSTTSHEFRTPLATILTTTEMLIHYRDRFDAEQINARLDKIRRHVHHLRQIMDDVLELARMQARRTEFKPIYGDLCKLFEEIVEEFNSGTEHHDRVRYETDQPVIDMLYDPRLMRQIMINLVSNALKYSPNGTPVDLRVNHQGDRVIITVQDYGIGIPQDSHPHMFEPFFRARNADSISGTGLGLPIVKESVEIHGGTVYFISELNKGTSFVVMLPIRKMIEATAQVR